MSALENELNTCRAMIERLKDSIAKGINDFSATLSERDFADTEQNVNEQRARAIELYDRTATQALNTIEASADIYWELFVANLNDGAKKELIFALKEDGANFNTPIPPAFLLSHVNYTPSEGEALLTPSGATVYFSHMQNNTNGKGFVCCDDPSLPKRGNYMVFEKLAPQGALWSQRLKGTQKELDVCRAKIASAQSVLGE